MSSWFRAAEELFEVVDRRAKQVTDDLLVGQSTATDLGVIGRVLATTPLAKAQSISGKVPTGSPISSAQANGGGYDLSLESFTGNSERSPDHSSNVDFNISVPQGTTPVIPEPHNISVGEDDDNQEVGADEVSVHTLSNGTLNLKDTLNNSVGGNAKSAQEAQLAECEPVKCRLGEDNGVVSVELVTGNVPSQVIIGGKYIGGPEEDRTEVLEGNADSVSPVPLHRESLDDRTQEENPKVEEQLDEAQGLLKVAVTSGQSKEARLARVCAGLSSRLQEYKTENAQLEALVQKEREGKASLEMQMKHMHSELASARAATSSVEAELSAALASKNAEIEVLLSSLENMKKQAALSEGKLATLQANMEVMVRSRDMTESGIIQTLKEELEAAECRAEEEHLAHSATRKAAVQRETELEQRVADVTSALTRMQRTVEERTQKAADLEQKLSTLEVDCANLNQELQDMEARLRREQKRVPEEAAQSLQLQAWREDADRARQAQLGAEAKLMAMEAENQKLRVELTGLKRNTEQNSTQAHIELEKRFRELTELLYLKQTQLEAMSSEKAAAVFQLEKELSKSREAQAEAERHKKVRHLISGWDDDNEMKPLEALGLQQRRLVGPSIQRAAKFLDSGAVTAGRFLWRRPLARLGVLLYLVFVHVFLLYLLHRLQEQVDNSLSSREEMEAAAAAGLVKLGMQR